MKRFRLFLVVCLLFSCFLGSRPNQTLAREALVYPSGKSADSSKELSNAPAASGWSSLGNGMNGTIYALETDGAGNLYAGGEFTTAGDTSVNNIAMWNGTSWSALGDGLDGIVLSLLYDGNGNLYAGGMFTHAGFLTVNHIAKWNGTSWSAMGGGFNNRVWAMAIDNLGNLYAGGYFMDFGQGEPDYLARWTGSAWVEVGGGMSGDYDGYVYDLLIDHNGDLIAGGDFDHAGGVSAEGVARWNGSAWSAIGDSGGGGVLALAEDQNHNIYVGGGFFDWGSTIADMIVRWDGTQWYDLDDGTNGDVEALVIGQDGNLYAGGYFSTAGNVNAERIAMWNGSNWSPLGSGLNDTVWALAVDSDGNLYAGGDFTTAGGGVANNIAKWTTPSPDLAISKTDGRSSLTPGASNTYTITVTNLSSEAVSGAIVQDIFPNTFTNVTWACNASVGSICVYPGSSGNIYTILNLAVGGTATLVAVGTVSNDVTCLMTNTATVTPQLGTIDPDLSNNQATDTSSVPNGACVFVPIVKKDS